jgi:hypothetical protein
VTDTWLYECMTEATIGRTIVTTMKVADFLKRAASRARPLAVLQAA